MSPVKHLTAVFCDDIRLEQGNKLSYMGVYGGNLLVPTFPAVLPKLCIAVRITTSPAPPSSLTFKLLRNEDSIAEREIGREILQTIAATTTDPDETPYYMVQTVFQLFPLELPGPCKFRARAQCDGEELKGGSLIVDLLAGMEEVVAAQVHLPVSPTKPT
jgi:hypothetical protein